MKILSLLLLSAALSPPAFAGEGTAGVRGGGTGIFCQGMVAPVTLEEYAVTASERMVSIPAERNAMPDWIAARLRRDRDLNRDVLAAWENLGAFDSWKAPAPGMDDLFRVDGASPSASRLSAQVRSVLHEMKLPLKASNEDYLIHDDFVKAPAGCKKVQLSLLQNAVPYRLHDGPLSEATKRVIELHEAIYLVGMTRYGHRLPGATRNLIVTALTNAKSDLKRAIREFTSPARSPRDAVLILRDFDYQLLDRNVKLSRPNCPLALSIVSDAKRDYAVSLQVKGKEVVRALQFPVPTPKRSALIYLNQGIDALLLPRVDALFFPDGEASALFPGSVAYLSRTEEAVYTLQIRSHARVFTDLGIRFPVHVTETSERIDANCRYLRVKADEEFPFESVAKTWNEILLNQ